MGLEGLEGVGLIWVVYAMCMQDAGGKQWNDCSIRKYREKVGRFMNRGPAVG